MTLEEAQQELAKVYPDEDTLFGLYQDFRLNALEAMILTTKSSREEYERILIAIIKGRLKIKKS